MEIIIARKDAGLTMNAAKEAGTILAIIPAVAAVVINGSGKGSKNTWSKKIQ